MSLTIGGRRGSINDGLDISEAGGAVLGDTEEDGAGTNEQSLEGDFTELGEGEDVEIGTLGIDWSEILATAGITGKDREGVVD